MTAPRPVFVLALRPEPYVDGIRALRRFAASSFPAALTMSRSINAWLLEQH
jgi:hypothetical protein